jgi:transcriptional regulator with PAS, ATPase and Fis domain
VDNASHTTPSSSDVNGFINAFLRNPFEEGALKSQLKYGLLANKWMKSGFSEIIENLDLYESYIRSYESFMLALHIFRAQKRELRSQKLELIADDPIDRLFPQKKSRRYKGNFELSDFRNLGKAVNRVTSYLKKTIIGETEVIRTIKKNAWSASFGLDAMVALYNREMIRNNNVLIRGESGTGKELFAQALLRSDVGGSNYKPGNTDEVNLASLPKEIISSELFGCEAGAFTGAVKREGKLVQVNNGSIFLDEIGDISKETQVGLLRVIEAKKVCPLGGKGYTPAKVRYISATNREISDSEVLRNDLFQRLAGIEIIVPPLRDRKDDIPMIGKSWEKTERHSNIEGSKSDYENFLEELRECPYHWPGNVRELRRQVNNKLMGLPTILDDLKMLSIPVNYPIEDSHLPFSGQKVNEVGYTVKELTDIYIGHAVKTKGYNITKAAKSLGVDRTTVKRRYDEIND